MSDNDDIFGKLREYCNRERNLKSIFVNNNERDSVSDDDDHNDSLSKLEFCFRNTKSVSKRQKKKIKPKSPVSRDTLIEPVEQPEPAENRLTSCRSGNGEPEAGVLAAPAVALATQPLPQGRPRRRGRPKKSTTQISEVIDISECTDSRDQGTVSSGAGTTRSERVQTLRGGLLRQAQSYRQAVAELAARCPQVDSIDLVSSPLPRVEGFISLDSDDEKTGDTTVQHSSGPCLEDPLLEVSNPEINVKVIWCGKNEIFELRQHQKFAHIIKVLAEKAQIKSHQVLLNLNDHIILPDDTPASIEYHNFDFINGRIISEPTKDLVVQSVRRAKKCDSNEISLKIQSDKWKRALHVDIGKTDNFRILFIKCAEELDVPYEQICLSFDGEPLEHDGTPAAFEMEGGEAIDLRLRK